MSQTDKNIRNQDEIDLGILLLSITKILDKRKYLIVILIILGITGGFLTYKSKNPSYDNNMIIQSNIINSAYASTLSKNISLLLKQKNYSEVSKKFAISIETAKQIKSFDIITEYEENIRKEDGEEVLNILYKINVEVLDNSALSELQRGVLSYMENTPYVLRQIEAKRTKIKKMITKLDLEILALDSMKSRNTNVVNYGARNGGKLAIFDPSNINTASLEFFTQKTNYEEELSLISGANLVDGFVPFEKPISPKLSTNLAIGAAVGLVFSIFVIVFIELRAYLKRLEAETQA